MQQAPEFLGAPQKKPEFLDGLDRGDLRVMIQSPAIQLVAEPGMSTRQPNHGRNLGPKLVLVADDESHVHDSISQWLSGTGWKAILASTTREALTASRDPGLSLALVDYCFPDGEIGIRLGRAIRKRHGIPFILISGYLNTSVVVQAMKAGALDVLDKPLTQNRLFQVLQRLEMSARLGPNIDLPGQLQTNVGVLMNNDVAPASERWARFVMRACSAREDPRRVPDWASAIGASEGTIDETCRLCGVTSRESRDLARVLRSIALARSTAEPVWTHLAVADERTLNTLLRRSGFNKTTREVDLHQFFVRQTFVPSSKQCLRKLAHLAANSPLFF